MVDFTRTDDVVSPRTLARILGMTPGQREVVSVCAGEWRREMKPAHPVEWAWRFYEDPDWEA